MKRGKHFLHLLGNMRLDIDPGRKRPRVALEENDRDIRPRFDLRERPQQFPHHRDLEDIQRRIRQPNPRHWPPYLDLNLASAHGAIHLSLILVAYVHE